MKATNAVSANKAVAIRGIIEGGVCVRAQVREGELSLAELSQRRGMQTSIQDG